MKLEAISKPSNQRMGGFEMAYREKQNTKCVWGVDDETAIQGGLPKTSP
jgi:hypothetical protein